MGDDVFAFFGGFATEIVCSNGGAVGAEGGLAKAEDDEDLSFEELLLAPGVLFFPVKAL